MKTIYYAAINRNPDGTYAVSADINEAEYGYEWDGNVAAYLANLDMEEGCEVRNYVEGITLYEDFGAHCNPENVTYIYYDGEPSEIWFSDDAQNDLED